jgi:hypothetical protein
MRNVELVETTSAVREMEAIYGYFDLDINTGRPTTAWENRNLKSIRLPEGLEHQFFNGFYLLRVQVNRRMMGALERVYLEINKRWSAEARRAHGLNRFVRCYSFGEGDTANLFWYGAAWELSAAVNGEILAEAIELFKQYGFKHDKRKLRIFEYW